MKMTSTVPSSWKDLQDKVAKYFDEAGYTAITPYKIETVRGTVEVDVFVEAPLELCKMILCECKYWDTPIPQEKVHAFRTVVSDSGASMGFVISKKGFQDGAYKAAFKTNVQLKTWDEFLEMIADKWTVAKIMTIKKKRAPLAVYLDPMDVPADKLSKEKQEIYFQTIKKYCAIHACCMWLDYKNIDVALKDAKYGIPEYNSREEYFDFLMSELRDAISIFENLFDGIIIEPYKFDLPDSYVYASIG